MAYHVVIFVIGAFVLLTVAGLITIIDSVNDAHRWGRSPIIDNIVIPVIFIVVLIGAAYGYGLMVERFFFNEHHSNCSHVAAGRHR